jgi:hypothetical protein
MKKTVKLFQPHHLLAYRKLDAAMPPTAARHPSITSVMSMHWFRQLSGVEVTGAARFPFVDIPQWHQYAQDQLVAWQFAPRHGKLVFINPYAKTKNAAGRWSTWLH